MSNELRDRIAEALYAHNAREFGFDAPVPWERLPAGAKESWYPRVDAILALPGIAVVELPTLEWPIDIYSDCEPTNGGVFLTGGWYPPADARALAARILAAAEYAEREQ